MIPDVKSSRGQQRNICGIRQTKTLLTGLEERHLSTMKLTELQPFKDLKIYRSSLKVFLKDYK